MSRKDEFLANAELAAAAAGRIRDLQSKRSLTQAAQCWRMLAEMEDALRGPPTRWPVNPPRPH